LKFYTSIRLDIRRIETLKDGDNVIGSRHRVRVVKNKVAPPLRIAEFDIMNDEGISKAGGVLDVAVEMEIIQKKGAFFSYKGQTMAQGREAAKIYLRENPKVAREIEDEIRKALTSGKEVPKELGEDKDEEGE
jgi:recombination protein RecA